jgi:hypothetical protein
MKSSLQLALGTLALSLAPEAKAGALGLLVTSGLHQERTYFYDVRDTSKGGIDSQMRPNSGFGLEALVGDKDEKVQGILRMGMLQDSPPEKPDTGNLAEQYAVFPPAHEQDPRQVGILGLGVQWGLLGDPTGSQLTVSSIVGTGFITTDNTEFLMVEAGVGGTHNLTSRLQATANLMATMRYRKRASYGPNVYAGIRYLFD